MKGDYDIKIYRIYKIYEDAEWDYYNDDFVYVSKERTIKYVDSKEKVDKFIQEIEEYNKSCEHCYNCLIVRLTKRKYNIRKSELDNYCYHKKLVFDGNSLCCKNEKQCDFDEYDYEEIEVE